jgi:ferrous iron transport protein B
VQKNYKIALLGNPNAGKSSIFNLLTGLRQKVGNFPGVTVDKKLGTAFLSSDLSVTLVDFPGTYSLYPTSQDERIVTHTFTNPQDENYPDAILYIADITQLEKHLLLLSQVHDLGLPVLLALNMVDAARTENLSLDAKKIEKELGIKTATISGRTGEGIEELKASLIGIIEESKNYKLENPFLRFSDEEKNIAASLYEKFPGTTDYQRILIAHHQKHLPFLTDEDRVFIQEKAPVESLKYQVRETMQRFETIEPLVRKSITRTGDVPDSLTDKIDDIVTHRIWGLFIFFGLMMLVFQAIFAWATVPMDWIDAGFGAVTNAVNEALPDTWYRSLLTDGVLAGISGVLIFIPQIAVLFFLISLLEESGYMARAVYLFDGLMRRFGLNGRSVVGLVSGTACAIPAIMSTRTIGNWKERLITIMVTPLISCSARIPVYTVLIAFVVPSVTVLGIFNAQGLVFMGLYMLGLFAALGSAWVFKKILKNEETSFLLLELPIYRRPIMKNVFLNVYEKTKTFVIEAGKVIFVISIILWFLASYGPTTAMDNAMTEATEIIETQSLDKSAANNLIASKKIEASYAGHLGKFIEPAIEPLGFDWKIGIALITSFAAREVFVGTMATIYSIGSDSDEFAVRDKLREAKNPKTGKPVYNWVTSLSLLIFYVFAMQCMSTLAVTKRETKSWKWAAVQFIFMTAMAYFGSLFVYQIWG